VCLLLTKHLQASLCSDNFVDLYLGGTGSNFGPSEVCQIFSQSLQANAGVVLPTSSPYILTIPDHILISFSSICAM
jgi:hypothetical protein